MSSGDSIPQTVEEEHRAGLTHSKDLCSICAGQAEDERVRARVSVLEYDLACIYDALSLKKPHERCVTTALGQIELMRLQLNGAAAQAQRKLEVESRLVETKTRLIELADRGAASLRALHDVLGWAHEWHGKMLPPPERAVTAIIDRLQASELMLNLEVKAKDAVKAQRDELRTRVEQLEKERIKLTDDLDVLSGNWRDEKAALEVRISKLKSAEETLNSVWQVLGEAGISHGQSVEGLRNGLNPYKEPEEATKQPAKPEPETHLYGGIRFPDRLSAVAYGACGKDDVAETSPWSLMPTCPVCRDIMKKERCRKGTAPAPLSERERATKEALEGAKKGGRK